MVSFCGSSCLSCAFAYAFVLPFSRWVMSWCSLTYDCLRIFRARGAQAELAQGIFGRLREGVEARFGGLLSMVD